MQRLSLSQLFDTCLMGHHFQSICRFFQVISTLTYHKCLCLIFVVMQTEKKVVKMNEEIKKALVDIVNAVSLGRFLMKQLTPRQVIEQWQNCSSL